MVENRGKSMNIVTTEVSFCERISLEISTRIQTLLKLFNDVGCFCGCINREPCRNVTIHSAGFFPRVGRFQLQGRYWRFNEIHGWHSPVFRLLSFQPFLPRDFQGFTVTSPQSRSRLVALDLFVVVSRFSLPSCFRENGKVYAFAASR